MYGLTIDSNYAYIKYGTNVVAKVANIYNVVTIAATAGSITNYSPLPMGQSVTITARKDGYNVSGQSIIVSAPSKADATVGGFTDVTSNQSNYSNGYESKSIKPTGTSTNYFIFGTSCTTGTGKNYKLSVDVSSVVSSARSGYEKTPTVTIGRSSGESSYNPLGFGKSVTLSAYKNGSAVSGQSITVSAPAQPADTNRWLNYANAATSYQTYLSNGRYVGIFNYGSSTPEATWWVPNAWFYNTVKSGSGPYPSNVSRIDNLTSNDSYVWIEYHDPNGRLGSAVGNVAWHINVPTSSGGGGGTTVHTPSVEDVTVTATIMRDAPTSGINKGNLMMDKYLKLVVTAYADCQGTSSAQWKQTYYWRTI